MWSKGLKRRVAVAMSGGIDSAVTAMLLKEKGFDCIGVFMKNWESSDERGQNSCPIDADREDMKQVCQRLEIPAYEVEFVKEYWNEVFSPFLESYQSGTETPNPDVYCNRQIKFNKFQECIQNRFGVNEMATGHYVRKRIVGINSTPTVQLLRGIDRLKDQSYFLSMTSGNRLENVHFPLGELRKSDVYEMAKDRFKDLNVLVKRESMGVCFIGKRSFPEFISSYINLTPGRFVDVNTGETVGTHKGKEIWTTGQCARIGGSSEKYFVVGRDERTSRKVGLRVPHFQTDPGDVFVALGSSHPDLFSHAVTVRLEDFNWISGLPEALTRAGQMVCEFKARYRQESAACVVSIEQESGAQVLLVRFVAPYRAATAGQILVLYDGDVCLGGGPITRIGE